MTRRGLICAAASLGLAWLAWEFSPRLIGLVGLDDLEFLGRICAVIVVLSVSEKIFARLPGADEPGH